MVSNHGNIVMDLLNFGEKLKNKSYAHTAEQDLAGQIYEFYGRKLNFGWIMRIIKRVGKQRTYEIFNEIRHSDCDDSLKLFIFKTKNCNLK